MSKCLSLKRNKKTVKYGTAIFDRVPYLTAIWVTVSPFNYDFVASQEYKSLSRLQRRTRRNLLDVTEHDLMAWPPTKPIFVLT